MKGVVLWKGQAVGSALYGIDGSLSLFLVRDIEFLPAVSVHTLSPSWRGTTHNWMWLKQFCHMEVQMC